MGKISYQKPVFSPTTALIELKLMVSLLQLSDQCRQMLWNRADLFQTDRVPAAAASPLSR
jgi:hypothetical protein